MPLSLPAATVANVSGSLYVVATPIGNLEDITFRAVRILKEADLIACEDTRHSRRLLDHFGIETPMISYHEHNEVSRSQDLIERIRSGSNIALISDAGTPLISDPGYRVVTAAVEAGIKVIPIPGASAILTALAASGLPTDSFYFGGFLPHKATQRRKVLEIANELESTLVFYEAPHRIEDALQDIAAVMPRRPVVVAREVTKLHEEFLRGPALDLQKHWTDAGVDPKGEITLVIGKASAPPADDRPIEELLEEHLAAGLSRMDAIKAIAKDRGVSKREIYAALEAKHK